MSDTLNFTVSGDDMQKRSDEITVGVDRAPGRSLLYATGMVKDPEDMKKPFIAICNSYIEIVPGHVHLRELADIAKEEIRKAGEFPLNLIRLASTMGLRWAISGCGTPYLAVKSLLIPLRPSLMPTGLTGCYTCLTVTRSHRGC